MSSLGYMIQTIAKQNKIWIVKCQVDINVKDKLHVKHKVKVKKMYIIKVQGRANMKGNIKVYVRIDVQPEVKVRVNVILWSK